MRQNRLKSIALGVMASLSIVLPTRADIEHSSPRLQGVLVSIQSSALEVETSQNQIVNVKIMPDCAFYIGHSIAIGDLAIGDTLAVSGLAIPVKGGDAVVIGRSIMIAAPNVAVSERAALARVFVDAAFKNPDPNRYERKVVVGTLERVEEGGFITLLVQGRRESVKLGPEALGVVVERGSRSDLVKGRLVYMAMPPTGVDAILIYR